MNTAYTPGPPPEDGRAYAILWNTGVETVIRGRPANYNRHLMLAHMPLPDLPKLRQADSGLSFTIDPITTQEVKLSSKEWEEQTGITILNADGWTRRGVCFREAITKEEFLKLTMDSRAQIPHEVMALLLAGKVP